MLTYISRSVFKAENYNPPVVVPPVIVYPFPVRKEKHTQQTYLGPIVSEILEFGGEYYEPDSQIVPPDSQIVPVAPSIIVQPIETQVGFQYLLDGVQIGPLIDREGIPYLEFVIQATGTNLTYQWKQNSYQIPNSNSPVLRIYDLYDRTTSITNEINNNNFYCVVSNELGRVQSSPVIVKTYNSYYGIVISNSNSTTPSFTPTIPSAGTIQYQQTITLSTPAGSQCVVDLNNAVFSVPYSPNKNLSFKWYNRNNTVLDNQYPIVNSKKIALQNVNAYTYYSFEVRSGPSNNVTLTFLVNILQTPLSGIYKELYQSIQAAGRSLLPTNLTDNLYTHEKVYIYNSLSNSGATFNTQFWGYSQRQILNFSGVSFIKDSPDNQVNATLVTPQHFITAAHFPPLENQTIYFWKQDGSYVTAVVESVKNNFPGYTDFAVGKLVYPITDSGIKIYPIVTDFSYNLYSFDFNYNLPIFAVAGKAIGNRDYGLSVMKYIHLNNSEDTTGFGTSVPTLSEFDNSLPSYRIGKWAGVGDSSNPVFCITSYGLTLISCWHDSGFSLESSGGGPSLANSLISGYLDSYLADTSKNPNGYTVTRVSMGMPSTGIIV
jgi:hypothetical protein